jgi:hypothetical protein
LVPQRTLPARFLIHLELPHASIDPTAPVPREVVASLNRALEAEGLGTADVGGASARQAPNGANIWEWAFATAYLRGSLDRGLSVMRAALSKAGASHQTRLELRSPERRPIPLRDGE